jgi:F-type H+-transporting ATPase subunit epsilon
VSEGTKTFQCTVISPQGRLLDCKASSVIIPAHDGHIGILPGHMPIFCQLGMGAMEVKCPGADGQPPTELKLIIDGGFVMFNSNNLAVTASYGVNMHDIKQEKFELLVERCKADLASPDIIASHRLHIERMLNLLESLRQNSPA